MLYDYEDDFKKIFKVRVNSDEEMVKWSDTVLLQHAGAVCESFPTTKSSCTLTVKRWPPFWSMAYATQDAAARSRRGSSNSRIWGASRPTAKLQGASLVTATHVREALDAKIERHNPPESKLREMIECDPAFIDTTGERTGR